MLRRFTISGTRTKLVVLLGLMALVLAAMVAVYLSAQQPNPDPAPLPAVTPNPPAAGEPTLTTEVLASGLANAWELGFLPGGQLVFTQRGGSLSLLENGQVQPIAQLPGVVARGEGGLMGLAVDPDFATNNYLYLCANTANDIGVTRWQLDSATRTLSQPTEIVSGIPSAASGRHSGCRLQMATDGVLWIGTGDAAQAQNPQDPQSLGGKILRVQRDGSPAPGNLGAPFDPRVFSYGHRNTQGLVIDETPQGDVYGLSVEHGSDRDDEINLLKPGNFGWAPRPPYNETVPMTDLNRFPEAVSAVWSSGSPTIAPSGAARLSGRQWGAWDGAVAVAVLKGRQLRIFILNDQNQVVREIPLLGEFGRLRTAVQGPDGNLYISTDNGQDDKIIKVTPRIS